MKHEYFAKANLYLIFQLDGPVLKRYFALYTRQIVCSNSESKMTILY